MPRFDLETIQDVLIDTLDKPLSDGTIPHELIAPKLAKELPFKVGKVTFTATAGAELGIYAFNSPDDTDADGVLGKPGNSDDDLEKLGPQVEFDANRAWLKYRVGAMAKGAGGASLASVGFKLDANTSIAFADYRRHNRNDNLHAAIVADIKGARFAPKRSDVLDLGIGDALSMQVAGNLSTSVTVKWSDVFAGSIGALGRLLKTPAVAVNMEASASVTASVDVTDDFLIVFSRVSGSTWRVGVKVAKARTALVGAGAKFEVSFDNPKQIEEGLNGLLGGFLSGDYAKIKALLAKPSFGDLTAAEKKIADKLVDRLGLRDTIDKLSDLKKEMDQLEKDVKGEVKEIANAKIAIGFAYEYRRISTESNLLQAKLDRAAIEKHHRTLIRGNLGGVLADAGGAGVTLENYLHEKKVERAASWGFTLGLGKWSAYGKDVRKLTSVQRWNSEERERRTYKGIRSYEGKWIGKMKYGWAVHFDASMGTYATDPGGPRVEEYDFGFRVQASWEDKKLGTRDVDHYLDSAVLWGALQPAQLDDAHDKIEDALGRKVRTAVEIEIRSAEARRIILAAADLVQADFIGPLAAAVAWNRRHPFRSDVADRRRAYDPIWRDYFSNPGRSKRELAAMAGRHLKNIGQHKLGVFEDKATLESFANLVTSLNGGKTEEHCLGVLRGLQQLAVAIKSHRRDDGEVEKAFFALRRFGAQFHHTRALGVFLLDVAKRTGDLDEVHRSVTLTYTKAKKDRVVIIGSKADA